MCDDPATILIVDDEQSAREVLEALLEGEGYQLVSASSGVEGLAQAARCLPDVILLDVMMPGLDGFEVCRRLRADPRLAEVPILLVTALDDRASRLQGLAIYADDFISKPFDGIELRARIRMITRLNRYRRLQTTYALLQTLSGRLLAAQEIERRALARELHDEIGQALTAVKIDLQNLQRRAGGTDLARQVEGSMAVVEGALQQVRSMSLDLRPSLLDDLGLVSALRWYLDRQVQRTGVSARFWADPSATRLPPDVETVCFRVAQEALTNVARHAQATEVQLILRQEAVGVELSIRDNGRGFDVGAAREGALRGGSLGLLGMEERVLLAGGRLEIQSAPGQGTEVKATLPVKT